MDIFLTYVAGILSVLFGIILLMSPETLKKLNEFSNRPLFKLDEVIAPFHTMVGVILVIVADWLLWAMQGASMAEFWYMPVLAVVSLFFGVLFLFSKSGLKQLSQRADKLLLATDDLVLAGRRTIGFLLVVAGVYIVAAVYLKK
jgi:hypothetical protein